MNNSHAYITGRQARDAIVRLPSRVDRLAEVLRHASLVPRMFRGAWLLALADELTDCELTDARIVSAIVRVSKLIGNTEVV